MTARSAHVSPSSLFTETLKLYEGGGWPKGTSTGWRSLDELYTIGLGQWTAVTGVPGSGKSEWVDALLVNLARSIPIGSLGSFLPRFQRRRTSPSCGEEGAQAVWSGPRAAHDAGRILRRGDLGRDDFVWLDVEMKSPDESIHRAVEYADGHKLGICSLTHYNMLEHQRWSTT